MLRTAVLVLGILFTVTGAVLCAVRGVFPGIQLLVFGGLLVCGVLFERWRYQNRNALQDAEWQRTGERFVDPETGKNVEVLYDPKSGERRYEPLAERYDKPD